MTRRRIPQGKVSTPGDPMKCNAKTKAGDPCKRWAIPGLDKCKMHCGLSKAERERRGSENIARHRIGHLLSTLEREPPPEVDPLEELLRLIAEVAREERVLASEIDDMYIHPKMGPQPTAEEANATWEGRTLYGPNHLGDGAPHVLKKMLDEARNRLGRLCKMALDAGVAERQVKLAEETGQLIAKVVITIIDDPSVSITQKQRQEMKKVARKHLTVVESA